MITILSARGIGATPQTDILRHMDMHLDPTRFRVIEVPYPAQYGPVPERDGMSFERTVQTGVNMTVDMIRKDPYPVILRGFSAGAAVMGHVADKVGRGVYPDLDVRGVALIADPFNPRVGNADKWGIAGSRPVNANFPVWRANDPKDVICCCPANSPLRTLADQTAAMTLADPVAWGQDLINRLITNRWQQVVLNFWQPRTIIDQYAQAIDDVRGYMLGEHVKYHLRPDPNWSYLDRIAQSINSVRG